MPPGAGEDRPARDGEGVTMLLQALHKYATDRNLLADLPFQRRTVHMLIPLHADGSPRGTGFTPLTTQVIVKDKPKEEPGRLLFLPRFPGENNGGRAYYLVESFHTVFGVRLNANDPLPCEPLERGDRNPVGAHQHFWRRIADGYRRTGDGRLGALLGFRERQLCARYRAGLRVLRAGVTWAVGIESLVASDERVSLFEWLRWQPNERARDKRPEWHGLLSTGGWVPLSQVNVCGFEIDGVGVHLGNGESPIGAGDPLWVDWAETYLREAFAAGEGANADQPAARETICLITGNNGCPVARSHKPKILGVPGLASGGYVVSFAKEAPAFSSFGFEMGANAPVSEQAAAGYALALNELLADDTTSLTIGGLKFCFWAEKQTKAVGLKFSKLAAAHPKAVADFLKEPFSGLDVPLARAEQFLSVTLSANAGRVVVREWLQVPLADAVESLKAWFFDLSIAALGEGREDVQERVGPYSLFRLAAAVVREGAELDRVSEVIAGLYRCALEKMPPPVRLLGPVLAEFRSALVTDSKKKPKYPFNQSRFALIKLVLTRTPSGGFTPMPHLCDTDDAAYNLGRLLRLLSALQDAAHESELEGAGIVERYYGTASSAPASVFAVLWKLHNHHLRKLEQQGDNGKAAAFAIRNRVAEIVGKFPASGPGRPPQFPRQLTLEEQGRFALGFYQQMAFDQQVRRDAAAKKSDAK